MYEIVSITDSEITAVHHVAVLAILGAHRARLKRRKMAEIRAASTEDYFSGLMVSRVMGAIKVLRMIYC